LDAEQNRHGHCSLSICTLICPVGRKLQDPRVMTTLSVLLGLDLAGMDEEDDPRPAPTPKPKPPPPKEEDLPDDKRKVKITPPFIFCPFSPHPIWP